MRLKELAEGELRGVGVEGVVVEAFYHLGIKEKAIIRMDYRIGNTQFEVECTLLIYLVLYVSQTWVPDLQIGILVLLLHRQVPTEHIHALYIV